MMTLNRKLALIISGFILVFSVLFISFDTLFIEKFYQRVRRSRLIEVYEQVQEYVDQKDVLDINGYDFILALNCFGEDSGNRVCFFDLDKNNIEEDRTGNYIANINDILNEDDSLDEPFSFEFIFSSQRGAQNVAYVGPINKENTVIGYALIYTPNTLIKENISIFNAFVLYLSLILVLLSIGASSIISKQVTKPIKEAEIKTRQMANLDFSTKLDVKSADEIGSLSISINKLSDELEKSINDLKDANKKLEEDIRFKEKVSKFREEFISDVSHELKTPISIISGYSEALKLEGLKQEDINQYADIIIDESMRMNKLVKDLLKFTQIESGMKQLDSEEFNINDIVNDVVKPQELRINDKKISLSIDIENTTVVGDYDMLSTVLNNYFTNALNHVDENRIIKLWSSYNNDKLRINVYNSGEPIKDEIIDRIWDSFYKVDKSRSRQYGGSGLGLSIVKTIMESYGNSFGVINEENGVTFYFDVNTIEKKE